MSFFAELRRRNVIRVGIAYAAVAWLLAQIADLALGAFGAADWVLRAFLIALLVGLPIALILAWIYELTPEGVRVDTDGVSDAAPDTERRLNRITVGVLMTAIVFLLVDKFYISRHVSSEIGSTQSIAVLPFVNMSADEDYFADGLSEELLNRLAKTPDLRVSARTSSFVYKDQQEDLREIGRALGVDHVLEGSVRRSGDRLRITAQLIKVSDGFHLWSETYDRDLNDIFLIQDDVSERIASALKVRLEGTRDAPDIDPNAYALYLEGVALGNIPTGDIRPALAKLDSALQIDPAFAEAIEHKAMLHAFVSGWAMESTVARSMVYEFSKQALAINPELPIAKALYVSANPDDWSWKNEIESLETAVRSAPNNMMTLSNLSYDYLHVGYFDEARKISERIIELDPLNLVGYVRYSNVLLAQGKDDEALTFVDEPGMDGSYTRTFVRAAVNLQLGRVDRAQAALDARNVRNESVLSFFQIDLQLATDPDQNVQYMRQWIADISAAAADLGEVLWAKQWLLPLGLVDEYLTDLERIRMETTEFWTNADALEHYCVVFATSGCRAHPKFTEIIRRSRMPELWEERGPPEHCSQESGDWVCR
ncbi:MAG: tetratricopeptide repeat protein [Gammaproteobacteria bacterium]